MAVLAHFCGIHIPTGADFRLLDATGHRVGKRQRASELCPVYMAPWGGT